MLGWRSARRETGQEKAMTMLDTTLCIGLECMGFETDTPSVADILARVEEAVTKYPALATAIAVSACVLASRAASSLDEARVAVERIATHVGSRN